MHGIEDEDLSFTVLKYGNEVLQIISLVKDSVILSPGYSTDIMRRISGARDINRVLESKQVPYRIEYIDRKYNVRIMAADTMDTIFMIAGSHIHD